MSVEERVRELENRYDELTEDVEPSDLRSYVRRLLGDINHTPALISMLSIQYSEKSSIDRDEVAGLQFIHHGLNVTRDVLETESWGDAGREPVEEDMKLLAADVLVSLGFDNLLQHYERATRIVDIFGTKEAKRVESSDNIDPEREAAVYIEVYRTAVFLVNEEPPEKLLEFVEKLAIADCALETGRLPRSISNKYYSEASHLASELDGVNEYIGWIESERNVSPTGIEVQD